MKLRATKKDILNGYNKVLRVSYCELQSLLNYKSPFAYSCGVYGWNCDYYNIDGVIISTGYSACGSLVDYKLVREYEAKADKIRHNNNHQNARAKLDKLIKKFIAKAVG